MSIRTLLGAAALFVASLLIADAAQAQSTLDRIVQAKVLRCGVMLDYPPAGFRNPQNQPDGFDVAYCRDMARAMGVEAQIVETPSPERLPALVSNRIDVLIASTSNTPQRALTVAFSQPYVVYNNVVLTRANTGIENFEGMKGRQIGGVTGTTTEQAMMASFRGWNDPRGRYTGYGSEAESYLALSQGKIDGMIVGNAAAGALLASGQFKDFVIRGTAPTPPDFCAIAVRRGDQEFLNWVNLFIWQQVRTGRYRELYNQYFGPGEPPSLTVVGVYY
jgi:polar amino acid transport system substrate-binding protein